MLSTEPFDAAARAAEELLEVHRVAAPSSYFWLVDTAGETPPSARRAILTPVSRDAAAGRPK